MRHAARTDAVQGPIIAALRAIGAKVYYIKEPVDLLVGFRGRTLALECKSRDGRLTKQQEEFLATWPGEAHVVLTPDDALKAVLGKDAMK